MKQYETIKHGSAGFPLGIHDTVCEKGFWLYPHIHREFEFLVVTKGKGVLYIEDEKFEIEAGEGVFINSEQLHVGIKTDEERAEFFAVVFSPEIFGDFAADAVVQKYVVPVLEKSILPKVKIEKSVVEKLCEIRHCKSELKIKSMLFNLWDECVDGAEKRENEKRAKNVEEIKRVMEYIEKNCEKEITLEALAQCVNMSRGYLCREFKKVVHMTPFEYLTQLRIDKGCEMLKRTDMPICEIAEKCGFNSFSYFTKVFRERMGCPPKKYRQTVENGNE